MNKAFKIIGIIGAVILCYMVILPNWQWFTTTSFDAANTINATANAYTYRATTATFRWIPLLLIVLPVGIGTILAYLVLKLPSQSQ